MTSDAWLSVLQAARGEQGWLALLKEAGSPEALLALNPRWLADAGLHDAAIGRLRSPPAATLDRWRSWLEQPGHGLIPFGSPQYPALLAGIPDPPLALWIDGARRELLGAPQLAIVGSRNASQGGRATAEQFARYLSERGLTITSGLASGIDAASHRGGLHGAGGTVAVLGCGIDVVFPRDHRALSREIADAGLLISEYPPGVSPRAYQFPERNRIIAGLSVGTLVVEAGRRSGSLITARWSGDYGREVFAIPGSIHNPLARGCHALIRQGAKLVEEGADILVELAPLLQWDTMPERALEQAPEPSLADDVAYAKVLEFLGLEPVAIGKLAERSGLTTAELSSMLLVLELEGFVEALPGGRYSRLPKRSR